MSDNDSISLRQLVAKNIRRERNRINLSQEGLAYRAEVHRTYIGAVERAEKNISVDNLERIAKALNVDISILVTGSSNETAS
jgi:transcriptional regulator with XRE-family HTH domain